jgi:rhodanese-related sulfurtransferase
MPSFNAIAPDKLFRLVGTPKSPVLVDIRTADEARANPRLVPSSLLAATRTAAGGPLGEGLTTVVIDTTGSARAEAHAALLASSGVAAEVLDGGIEAWQAAALPTIRLDAMPPAGGDGRTIWVTKARPKIDRIACPWLIRRFIDPLARFLFVSPSAVTGVADIVKGTPFDIEDAFFTHRGELCTFDVLLQEFDFVTLPLERLARMVRGADTARPDLSSEAPGLLAVSLGLSRMFGNDLEQLEAGMLIYDALYRWCRDATEETHNWPTAKARS